MYDQSHSHASGKTVGRWRAVWGALAVCGLLVASPAIPAQAGNYVYQEGYVYYSSYSNCTWDKSEYATGTHGKGGTGGRVESLIHGLYACENAFNVPAGYIAMDPVDYIWDYNTNAWRVCIDQGWFYNTKNNVFGLDFLLSYYTHNPCGSGWHGTINYADVWFNGAWYGNYKWSGYMWINGGYSPATAPAGVAKPIGRPTATRHDLPASPNSPAHQAAMAKMKGSGVSTFVANGIETIRVSR